MLVLFSTNGLIAAVVACSNSATGTDVHEVAKDKEDPTEYANGCTQHVVGVRVSAVLVTMRIVLITMVRL